MMPAQYLTQVLRAEALVAWVMRGWNKGDAGTR